MLEVQTIGSVGCILEEEIFLVNEQYISYQPVFHLSNQIHTETLR